MGRMTSDKVMIACVTSEVTMIVQPAVDENIDRIHLIHFVKRGELKNDRAEYYQKFYDETARLLAESGIEVVEHSEKETYIFRKMMSEVHAILRDEVDTRGSRVYVNMSSGTSEYAAAAAICSMMFNSVEIFTVAKGYDGRTVDYSSLLEYAKKDGRLVGSCSVIGGTHKVEKFPIQSPEEYLLKAFKIYSAIYDSEHRNSNTVVIRNLILQNVWMAKSPIDEGAAIRNTSVSLEDPGKGYSCPREKSENYSARQRAEAVQYCRVYIDRWYEDGWIKRIGNTKKYEITEEGRTVLDVFCPDSLIKFGPEDIVLQQRKYSD